MTTARSSGAGGAPRRRSARSSRPPRSRTTGGSSSTSSSDARVGRPHGLDGSFHATRPLAASATLLVDGEPRAVERRAGTAERPIIRLAGCTSREDAEALRGASLEVPRDQLRLEEGEFWASDLEGCHVFDGDRPVGVVSRMIALPSCEALEVGDVLIPLVRDAIRSIDVEGRRIDVDMGFVGS